MFAHQGINAVHQLDRRRSLTFINNASLTTIATTTTQPCPCKMRLFLLPISTRRTLIFCERVQESLSSTTQTGATTKQPYSERLITKASETWAGWEKKESGWQKKVTEAGNTLFRRIPFEEWGLKTIPPATNQRIQDVDAGKLGGFECLYPGAYLKERRVLEELRRISVERQGLHGRRIWQSVALMPVVAPFALVPV